MSKETKAIARQGPLRRVSLQDGSQTIEVRLDELPPPSDSYLADWYHASLFGRMCTFTFGKLSVRGDALVTVLSLVLPLALMKGLAETLGSERQRGGTFAGQLEEMVQHHGAPANPRRPLDEVVSERTREHSLAANFAVLGYNDSDATISFYRLPPTLDIARLSAERLDRVQVIPVVRVDTSAPILLEFARSVTEFAKVLEQPKP